MSALINGDVVIEIWLVWFYFQIHGFVFKSSVIPFYYWEEVLGHLSVTSITAGNYFRKKCWVIHAGKHKDPFPIKNKKSVLARGPYFPQNLRPKPLDS